MKHSLLCLFAACFIIACGHVTASKSYELKKEHFMRATEVYDWPLSILKLSLEGVPDTTMVCCGCANDLCDELCRLKGFDENNTMKWLFNKCVNGVPIPVPTEVYERWSVNRVIVDDSLSVVYSNKGIDGILSVLSSKSLSSWYLKDSDRFHYIVSLCWNHDLFFSCWMNDEYPVELEWFISGNTNLLESHCIR